MQQMQTDSNVTNADKKTTTSQGGFMGGLGVVIGLIRVVSYILPAAALYTTLKTTRKGS
jgi:hypothetical protein